MHRVGEYRDERLTIADEVLLRQLLRPRTGPTTDDDRLVADGRARFTRAVAAQAIEICQILPCARLEHLRQSHKQAFQDDLAARIVVEDLLRRMSFKSLDRLLEPSERAVAE